jgi:hypothetical protein
MSQGKLNHPLCRSALISGIPTDAGARRVDNGHHLFIGPLGIAILFLRALLAERALPGRVVSRLADNGRLATPDTGDDGWLVPGKDVNSVPAFVRHSLSLRDHFQTKLGGRTEIIIMRKFLADRQRLFQRDIHAASPGKPVLHLLHETHQHNLHIEFSY